MDEQRRYLVYCRLDGDLSGEDLDAGWVAIKVAPELWIVKTLLDSGSVAAICTKFAHRISPFFVCEIVAGAAFVGHVPTVDEDARIRTFLGLL